MTQIVIYFAISLAFIGGWIANLVYLFGMLGGPINAMFVARLSGVFAVPLG